MPLKIRALEMHGHRMWELASVQRVLTFMTQHQMNTLVLHESDLVHQIVYPRAYFDPYALWSDLPSRRGENAIFNRRAYIDHLLTLATAQGISVWLNVKEIGFSDEVLALRPALFKDGAICPSEPFWTEYIGHKTDELFSDFPALGGLIVSFGSQESRASRAQNRCRCALCQAEPLQDWYSRLIACLHQPVARHGKRLAVRDFAYKPSDHAPLMAAVDQAPPDVIFCIKAMPHDFYLSFPDNPAIRTTARSQWVEYDVMGQFFGWGIMPCLVLDDLRQRMQHWDRHAVEGGIFRIEWERINDLDCFDTLNEINLIAAAALARGVAVDSAAACHTWLNAHGHSEAAAPWLAGLLDQTAPIVVQAAYLNGFVSADNSMLPRSIERAWWGMENRDSLAVWDRTRSHDLELTSALMAQAFHEKDLALQATRDLLADVRSVNPAVESALRSRIVSAFAWFETWVEGLSLCTKVCLQTRWLEAQQPRPPVAEVEVLETLLTQLERYSGDLRVLANSDKIGHQVKMLLDYRRANDILREARAKPTRCPPLPHADC